MYKKLSRRDEQIAMKLFKDSNLEPLIENVKSLNPSEVRLEFDLLSISKVEYSVLLDGDETYLCAYDSRSSTETRTEIL